MILLLNTLCFLLFALAAASYVRQRFVGLWLAGLLFFPLTGLATVWTWWPVSPLAAILILVGTLGVPLVCLALFAIDVMWAPFCLEMAYLTILCWVLCPQAVLLNYLGAALHISSGTSLAMLGRVGFLFAGP
jgi:hypothetical protein